MSSCPTQQREKMNLPYTKKAPKKLWFSSIMGLWSWFCKQLGAFQGICKRQQKISRFMLFVLQNSILNSSSYFLLQCWFPFYYAMNSKCADHPSDLLFWRIPHDHKTCAVKFQLSVFTAWFWLPEASLSSNCLLENQKSFLASPTTVISFYTGAEIKKTNVRSIGEALIS